MKTIERLLCVECVKTLRDSQVVFKKVPNTDGTNKCDWCRKIRYGAKYQIQYGRGARHAEG